MYKRKLAYLALLITAVIWGVAPPVIKYTLRFVSPMSFLFFRFLIASLIIIVPTIIRIKKIKLSKKDWLAYLFLGFLCAPLNLILLFLGIEKTTAIDASLISIISPILVVVGGALLLREKVTKIERIGIFITVIGTFLTIFQPLFDIKTNVGLNIEGNLLVLAGTLVWVVFTLLAKKYRHLDPFILSSLSFCVGLFTLLIFFVFPFFISNFHLPISSFSFPISHFSLPPAALPGILFMAIFSSVVAYFAYVYGLSKIEASEATIFTYLQPIFAIPISVIFLGEKITLPFFLGALLIVSGVFICERLSKTAN